MSLLFPQIAENLPDYIRDY